MKPTHKKVIVLPLFKCTPNGLSLSDEKREWVKTSQGLCFYAVKLS